AEPRERVCRARRHREGDDRRGPGDEDRVEEPMREVRLREQVLEVLEPEVLRDERGRTQGPERIERRRRGEQDGDQREDDRPDGDDVAPADSGEPALSSHRLISSRAAVRLNPMIETPATITKMSTDTAAANPYWAPPSAKASL